MCLHHVKVVRALRVWHSIRHVQEYLRILQNTNKLLAEQHFQLSTVQVRVSRVSGKQGYV